MARTEHVYVPYNAKPPEGEPYFAIGGTHWSAEGARNFMGDPATWKRLRRDGWKVVKCKLVPVGAGKRTLSK